MRRLLTTVLSVAIILMLSACFVSAESGLTEVDSAKTIDDVYARAKLSISGSTAYCSGTVNAPSEYSVSLTVTLQKQQSSGAWFAMASQSANAKSLSFSTSVSSGSWRVYVHAAIYDSNGVRIDTITDYSGVVTVP